ncbi:MAG: response regulator [Deltaproteobacteria bacterium]|nr:response regulator [Deltaproteobacteria bacterium]
MKKVLIVDDSKVMRLMIRRTLRQAGFESLDVHEAENGVEGIAQFKEQAPQVVLADWNMPEMGGLELLENLRGIEPNVVFGFITSEQSDEIRSTARQAGARFLIPKPFTPDDFKVTLGTFLR